MNKNLNLKIKEEARQECIEELIKQTVSDEDGMMKIVRQICSKYQIDCIDLKKSQLLDSYGFLLKSAKITVSDNLNKLLTKRRIRTQSGVSVISVMTKSLSCPGQCTYCPNQANMPKSYLDNQPAAMRGVMFDFDPYEQVRARLEMLASMGHDISKNEVIILGGTFSAHPANYQEIFVKRIFDAFNSFGADEALIAASLPQAKKYNEKANCRLIGLTVETRPDFISMAECAWLRYLGVTRVELGVQSVFDDVLLKVKRGHTVAQTKEATNLLRQAGFKIVYHIMPGLPGSDPGRDEQMFNTLFADAGFYPDHLKIYPTVVLADSELYKDWQAGHFKPYSQEEVINLLTTVKQLIPEWVRIVRVMRDIPEDSIIDGVKSSNLRQLIQNQGVDCRCIRCREPKEQILEKSKIKYQNYRVSGGREHFISVETEDEKNILALVRLFLPEDSQKMKSVLPEISGCALIRELHTYGKVQKVGAGQGKSQHRGYGKKLMMEAEVVAREDGFKCMAVIAGVGVREYYAKLGYRLQGEYMIKDLI